MSEDNQQNKRAMLAVVLSGLILLGWNYIFPQPAYEASVKSSEVKDVKVSSTADTNADTKNVKNVDIPIVSDQVETITLSNSLVSVSLNNFLSVTSYKAFNSDKLMEDTLSTPSSYLSVNKEKLFFNFLNQNENSVEVTSKDGSITGQLFLTDKGSVQVTLKSSQLTNLAYVLESNEKNIDGQKINSFSYYSGEDLELNPVGEKQDTVDSKVSWVGLDYDYHLFSFLYDETQTYQVSIKETATELKNDDGDFIKRGILSMTSIKPSDIFSYQIIYLKKNYDDLLAFDDKLKFSVDFGLWAPIALPILRGLQIFYNFFQNYGIAIIFLTIVIRFLTFPLQYKSFKSMKKMQVVQPEIQKIKDKYKDNPQKVQQETMALFKREGANPIGGCLPMLLQMPIFFAFYKVLYTAVELVDAPFYFWIYDLSSKDPYFVLPVLMGLAMFLNMKLTPNTSMDPAQQKVMMLMPIMFTVFMVNLPSGLTLYILVSTIVGMLQQLFVFKRT